MALKPQPSLQDRRLEIGEEVFTLRFSLRAVRFLQDLWSLETEEQVQVKVSEDGDQIDIIRDLMLACLQTYHREMTADDAFEIVDALGPTGAQEKIMEAVVAALPPKDDTSPPGEGATTPP